MGEITTTYFNRLQQRALELLIHEPFILSSFYLTGGTALAACYLNHRESDDIDLFSAKKVDATQGQRAMSTLAQKLKTTISYTRIHEYHRFDFVYKNGRKLKIDLNQYPYRHIERPNTWKGLAIDSLADIAVNKLLTISQRTTTKDYVDLYFLLKKDFTFWDLMHGAKQKFGMEIEPLYAASLFTKVEELDTLPMMKKPLKLETLKKFFLSLAKRQGRQFTKP